MTIHIIVLAAGQSSRMKSKTSKVLHRLAGWPVLRHVLNVAQQLEPASVMLVTSPGGELIINEGKKYVPDIVSVIQEQPLGTGHAVQSALPFLGDADGTVLVLYGDSPLITVETLQQLVQKAQTNDVVLTAMKPADPAQYGRLKLDGNGKVTSIIEYKDATETERHITLCNAGVMAIRTSVLPSLLDKLDNDNAKGEYYLTDIIAHATQEGARCDYIVADEEEMLGVNNRVELAQAEQVIQSRLRDRALQQGVGMVDPNTVYLSMDTEFGKDVLIHPFVVFGTHVQIADDVEIHSFSHLDGAVINDAVTIGPYARLRPGANVGKRSSIGNFVEVKNSVLHEGVKSGHLSYIGDAEIGANTNIGAGTITCNYDGRKKHKTSIGSDVFVGSGTAFVAPVNVGDNTTIGAGSVVTDDVPDFSLSIARARQVNKKDWKK